MTEQRVREFAFGIMDLKGKELDWEVRDETLLMYNMDNPGKPVFVMLLNDMEKEE